MVLDKAAEHLDVRFVEADSPRDVDGDRPADFAVVPTLPLADVVQERTDQEQIRP